MSNLEINRSFGDLGLAGSAGSGDTVWRDPRPRWLRRILPNTCAMSAPIDGMQQARLWLVAYH